MTDASKSNPNPLDEFMSDRKIDQDQRPLLEDLVEFLRERGQYIDPGEIKKQFIETRTIDDRNKVPIEVFKCLVCGHEEFEVKT